VILVDGKNVGFGAQFSAVASVFLVDWAVATVGNGGLRSLHVGIALLVQPDLLAGGWLCSLDGGSQTEQGDVS